MEEEGFTLVEVLAAVTITAIILVSLFALLEQSFDLWRAVGTYNHWEQNLRVLEAQLSADLHNLYFSPLTRKNLLRGSPHSIEFYRLSSKGIMKKISYSFNSYERKLIKEVDYLGTAKKEKLEFFADLEIEELEFQFYASQAEYFKSYWSQEEIAAELATKQMKEQLENYLPQAVQLKIKLAKVELPVLLIENFKGRNYGG